MELHIWPTARYMRKELRHDTDVYECVFISPTDAHPVSTNNILIYEYIQQDATLHSLFYLETALHVSGGTTTHHQERKQLYLQHLVIVTPL